MNYNKELFGEIEKFVDIEIESESFSVPDKLELLRVFQFLEFSIDYARLCWNASCQRCFVEYLKGGKKVRALACRTKSFQGMTVRKLPPTIRKSAASSTPEDPESTN